MIVEAVHFVIAGAGAKDDLMERQIDIESCDGNVRSGFSRTNKMPVLHPSKTIVWEQRTQCNECT